MTTTPPSSGATEFTPGKLARSQFSYHVRMTAAFAVAGQSEESAAEAVLSWAMLAQQWPDAADAAAQVAAELVDVRVASLSEAARDAALIRARGLALDIEAHYVSVGCADEATLYAQVADAVADAVADLVAR